MASAKPPYVTAYGNIGKALKKIKAAQVPPRFTQDFLATKLGLPGGSAKPLIPFLKRTGLLGSDGVPTDRYKRFRNPGQTGKAAAEALREGYKSLYEINENVHDASDDDLSGVVVQATGLEPDSSTTRATIGSFKALKDFAVFDTDDDQEEEEVEEEPKDNQDETERVVLKMGLGLSYTINLIFKSLNEHLLK
jgi:hypothetical protein